MSRDSSATQLHLTSSRYADLFEEFCRPPSSTNTNPSSSSNNNNSNHPNAQQQQQQGSNSNHNSAPGPMNDGSGMTALPGSFLPFEEIHLPPHLMPLNPEDEDGVVPDMHAAFGINHALGQGAAGANTGGGGGSTSGTAAGGMGGGVGGSGGIGGLGGEASLAGVQREPAWRDLGLQGLMADVNLDGRRPKVGGSRREGRRTGLLFLR